ncbi:type II secretion system F family protein [Zhongshania sp.]|uniref:type II secretion system F family protein n=1 Tax=Zhongshania sp. TaxID=1971902 RepID=UPI00356252EF
MFWIVLALLVISLAFILVILITSDDESAEKDKALENSSPVVPQAITLYLAGNGVELPATIVFASLALAGSAALFCLLLLPIEYGFIAALCCLLSLIGLVKFIGNHRRAKMLEQLPSFINQVTRRLSAGVSVENAFSDSVETLEAPLSTVMKRIVRRVHMGYELHQAFDREAGITKLHEFNVLATSIRINEQYGGSIRSILDDIVSILRLEDAGKRELSAMTGETRFTAVVLAILPPLIAAYMFSMNPEMLLGMWAEAGGKSVLIAAAAMEILGVIVLWRMIKSIDA